MALQDSIFGMQIVEVVDSRDKERRLEQLLRKIHKDQKNKVLVFALYKKEAARIERMLWGNGWNVKVRLAPCSTHISVPVCSHPINMPVRLLPPPSVYSHSSPRFALRKLLSLSCSV
jgi:hypothetical protein